MTPVDPLALAARIAAILDSIGVRYVIGGSVAASVVGEPRSTLDLDLMVELDDVHARLLVASLQDDFYIDEEMVLEAVRAEGTFNAIHYASSMRIDFFIAEDFATRQLDRRRELRVRDDLPPLCFYSAEDLVVRKLMWFRLGGEVSNRQWRDVLGILKTSWQSVDIAYLESAAEERDVGDLLLRARDEAGVTP